MKVWISKYALTKGIFVVDDVTEENDKIRVKINDKMDGVWDAYYGEGKEWHRTQESAPKRHHKRMKPAILDTPTQLCLDLHRFS